MEGGYMPIIEQPNFSRKRQIPSSFKFVLLIAVALGLYIRSCNQNNSIEKFKISEINVMNKTSVSVDVLFKILNTTDSAVKKNILIKLYDSTGQQIASKLTSINIQPRTNERYRKVISMFEVATDLVHEDLNATIEIYIPSIL